MYVHIVYSSKCRHYYLYFKDNKTEPLKRKEECLKLQS